MVSLVSGTIVISDILTKLAVIRWVEIGTEIFVVKGLLNLTHHQNPGVAFGFMRDLPSNFGIVLISSIAVVAIVFISSMIRNNSNTKRAENFALALILGGAIGNLANRLWLGYVTDFIDFHWRSIYHFPAFNVADVAICLGVFGITIVSIKHDYLKTSIGSDS